MSGVVVACPCGEVYELKPQYAGRLLECPVCGRHLRAGGLPEAARRAGPDLDPAFDRDVFLLRERLLTIRAKYEVRGEDGTPILYVERPTYPVRTVLAYLLATIAASLVFGETVMREPGLGPLGGLLGYLLSAATFFVVATSARPRRHVTVYRDESRREVLLRIVQNERLAVLQRTYTVVTGGGAGVTRLRKRYLDNVLRKRWYVEPDGRPVAMAIEDSVVLSLLRRLLGPLFGVLRTNFLLVSFQDGAPGPLLGEFNRKFTLLDRYVLDLRADAERRLDRRIALALGIMLDTGEGR